jgi:cytochrome c-type biogenesis protein
MASVFAVVKRHYGAVVFTGGAVLIAMGVLIWTNELTVLNVQAETALQHLGINFFDI